MEVLVKTFKVELPEPPVVDVGLKVPVVPVGKPLTLRTTVPVNPFSADTLVVKLVLPPALTD
jgi:hypothetical protein